MWETLPSHKAIPSAHVVGTFPSSNSLPLVSSLNALSCLDLHILTNPSRLERTICSVPIVGKTRPKTHISSVCGCGGMSGKGYRAKSGPRPVPLGKVVWVWRERSGPGLREPYSERITATLVSTHLAAWQLSPSYSSHLQRDSSLCPWISTHLPDCSTFPS